jgi:hypothetical protein
LHWHAPLEQVAFAPQLLPHEPQFVELVLVLTSHPSDQLPLQLPQPALQLHRPLEQYAFELQLLPHVPQFVGLV